MDAAEVASLLGLAPLEVEGGRFAQTWAGVPRPDGRPGQARRSMPCSRPVTRGGSRPCTGWTPPRCGTTTWATRSTCCCSTLTAAHREVTLGDDVRAGQRPQLVIPAGVWMGASVAAGGRWTLIGCTMAPGFVSGCYEGGTRASLTAAFPAAARRIAELTRPGHELGLPQER